MDSQFTQAYAIVGPEGFPFIVPVWVVGFQIRKEMLVDFQRGQEEFRVLFSKAHICELRDDDLPEHTKVMLMLKTEPSWIEELVVEFLARAVNAQLVLPGNIYLEKNDYVREGEYQAILKWLGLS